MRAFDIANWTIPPVCMLGLVTYLWLQRRLVLKSPLAIVTIALTTGASLLGLYGWINFKELVARDTTDYRFEHICRMIAIVAMVRVG